jgi:hypothetical protein
MEQVTDTKQISGRKNIAGFWICPRYFYQALNVLVFTLRMLVVDFETALQDIQ